MRGGGKVWFHKQMENKDDNFTITCNTVFNDRFNGCGAALRHQNNKTRKAIARSSQTFGIYEQVSQINKGDVWEG